MAAITWSDVVGWAPQLAQVNAYGQIKIPQFVNDYWDPETFGGEDSNNLLELRLNHAAHEGTMWLRRGQGGAVTGERIGTDAVDLTYAAPFHGSINEFEATSYGQKVQSMINTQPGARFL
jgi:hypothetical protein